MYGYEMVKVVNARSNGRLEWREGTLYPTLHRLEAGGWVSSRWEDVPGDGGKPPGRQRKYYFITRKGRTELVRRTQEWRQFSLAVNAMLLGSTA
jgi:DNA-binding PadR family transcriptional regulator